MLKAHRPCAPHLRCTSPIRVKWDADARYIDVRCKRCQGCRLTRQYGWIVRAAHEQAFAKKTWFVTLTFRPVERAKAMADASSRPSEHKTPQQRLVAATGVPITAYMKALRKRGYAARYLMVPELHRDGFPHWHGLVHDLRGDLTWKALATSWSSGFSVIKLVRDEKAIRYVTKYLSKDMHGRVRASLRYGDPSSAPIMKQAQGAAALPSTERGGDGNGLSPLPGPLQSTSTVEKKV